MIQRKLFHISIVDNFRRKAKTAHSQGSNGTLAWKAKKPQAEIGKENISQTMETRWAIF
jgi:hypothetical protein